MNAKLLLQILKKKIYKKVNFKNFINQSFIIILISILVSFFFNFIRSSNSLPIIANKNIISGGFSTADSLLSNETILFEPTLISLKIAKSMFDKDVIFIDSRDELEFNKSHILNAKLAPANPGEILKWVDEDDPIVTYCSGGECSLSLDLARILMGEDWAFSKVFVYDGGIMEWENAGFPTNKLNE